MKLAISSNADLLQSLFFGVWVGYVDSPYLTDDIKIFRNAEGISIFVFGVRVAVLSMVGGMVGSIDGQKMTQKGDQILNLVCLALGLDYKGQPIPVTEEKIRTLYTEFQETYSFGNVLKSFYRWLDENDTKEVTDKEYIKWINGLNNQVLRQVIEKNNYRGNLIAQAEGMI